MSFDLAFPDLILDLNEFKVTRNNNVCINKTIKYAILTALG